MGVPDCPNRRSQQREPVPGALFDERPPAEQRAKRVVLRDSTATARKRRRERKRRGPSAAKRVEVPLRREREDVDPPPE